MERAAGGTGNGDGSNGNALIHFRQKMFELKKSDTNFVNLKV